MTNSHYKTSALALAKAAEDAGYPLSTYALLNITDTLILMGVNFTDPNADPLTHDGRVTIALNSPEVMGFMRETRKINAIKELRRLTNCGLKEAKDAVEDSRVYLASGYQGF